MFQTTNVRVSKKKPKRSSLFFVSVSYAAVSKEHLFFSLEVFCVKLLVAEEKHYNISPHHYVYLRIEGKFLLSEIKEMICEVYNIALEPSVAENVNSREIVQEHLNISNVRNESNACVLYATKYDTNQLFKGLNESSFSFYHGALQWVRHSRSFRSKSSAILSFAWTSSRQGSRGHIERRACTSSSFFCYFWSGCSSNVQQLGC